MAGFVSCEKIRLTARGSSRGVRAGFVLCTAAWLMHACGHVCLLHSCLSMLWMTRCVLDLSGGFFSSPFAYKSLPWRGSLQSRLRPNRSSPIGPSLHPMLPSSLHPRFHGALRRRSGWPAGRCVQATTRIGRAAHHRLVMDLPRLRLPGLKADTARLQLVVDSSLPCCSPS